MASPTHTEPNLTASRWRKSFGGWGLPGTGLVIQETRRNVAYTLYDHGQAKAWYPTLAQAKQAAHSALGE